MSVHFRSATVFVGVLLNSLITASGEEDNRFTPVVRRFLQGDASARTDLENAPKDAIAALEDHLLEQGNRELTVREVRQLISQLGDDNFQTRETATLRLRKEGAAHRGILEAALKESSDPEVAFRLQQVMTRLARAVEINRSQVPLILQTLYRRHLKVVAPNYFENFETKPHDRRALLFFKHMQPTELTVWSAKLSRPKRLHYLLALLFVQHEAARNPEIYEGYSGEEIRSAAKETFWPVEIHPPVLDGAYHWTVRAAKIEGRRASNIMKMSIEKRYETGEMKHIQSWPQWDYLFRYKSAYLGTYDGVAVTTAHAGNLRTENVLRLPDEMSLPVAEVTYKEQQRWGSGRNFDWSRLLYPIEIVDRVAFEKSPYQPPSKIIMTQ